MLQTASRRSSSYSSFGHRFAPVCLALVMAGCVESENADPEVAVADTVFQNGRVHTVNSNDDVVESIAIKDGIITAVGSDSQLASLIGESTRVIDLNGRMLMPGLVDGHMHPTNAGPELLGCTLRDLIPNTVEAALSRITACIEMEPDAPADSWLQVRGWSRTPLTAAALDRLPTDRPVVVQEYTYHALVANSRAMQLAGITSDTTDPVDGKVDRHGSGEPTGIFYDGAQGYVRAAVPQPSAAAQHEQNLVYLEAVLQVLREEGVTTVFDAAAGPGGMAALLQKHDEGQLSVRAQLATVVSADAAESPGDVVAHIKELGSRFNTPREAQSPGFRVETAKIFLDGVVGPAETGALLEPYRRNVRTPEEPNWQVSDSYGPTYFEPPAVSALLDELAANDINIHMHATGDRAVNVALNAIAEVRAKHPEKNFRPSLAHASLVDPGDYQRFAELDATPVLSFQWSRPRGGSFQADVLGPERFRYFSTTGKFHEAGVRVAFGSDWPIDPLNEWLAMQIAITRTNPTALDLGRLGDDPGLDLATTIRAMTLNAAYTLNMDQYVGSLEVGKFADLIVLDRDLTAIAPEEISNTRVLLTMVGGREVFRAPSLRTTGASDGGQ